MSQQILNYAKRPSRVSALGAGLSRRLRRTLPYVAVIVICYVGSYVCLSAFGRFQPAVIGAGATGTSVKWYRWSPAGFHSGYRQRWILYDIYLPLYFVDHWYWHRPDDAYNGKYPASRPTTPAEWAEWRG
jgi:hypothetical protein